MRNATEKDIEQIHKTGIVPTNVMFMTPFGLAHKLVSNAQQSRSLAQIRDTLLPKLISGELRVGDADKYLRGIA